MTGQTPTIVPLRPAVNEDAVEQARLVLKRCEAGEIVDFVFAGTKRDGGIATVLTPTDDQFRRIAAVSRLLHMMHLQSDEAMRDGA